MVDKQFEIKDSGERRSFETGAKRDVDYDKPRFDLIPTTALKKIIDFHQKKVYSGQMPKDINDDSKVRMLSLGLQWGDTANDDLLLELVWIVLDAIRQQENDKILCIDKDSYSGFHLISPKTYLRIANHYGGGAKKYDPWNWSKGMPFSVFHASMMRHIFDVIDGKIDEDHLSAIFFNIAAIIHFRIIQRIDVDDVTPRLEEWKGDESN